MDVSITRDDLGPFDAPFHKVEAFVIPFAQALVDAYVNAKITDEENATVDLLTDLFIYVSRKTGDDLDSLTGRAIYAAREELKDAGYVTVHVENYYSDEHKSERWFAVEPPHKVDDRPLTEDEIEEWFTDTVYQYTGDGHGEASDLGSCYATTVEAAPGFPELHGKTYEWTD